MTPTGPIIEQQHKVRRVITFPSGKLTFVPVTTETSTIDPTTGERTLFIDEHRYRTADGRDVKPDELAVRALGVTTDHHITWKIKDPWDDDPTAYETSALAICKALAELRKRTEKAPEA